MAGQYDQEDGARGWSVTLGSRQLNFRLTGERNERGAATSARVGPINTKRMPAGEWTHVVLTHDGSGERGGLHVYQNGERVEEQGSEFFAKAEGSIVTDKPFYLGRGDAINRGVLETRHFAGGGVADLRVFDRALTVQEAKVVSEWRTLQGATVKSPQGLTMPERNVLRLRYLSIDDEPYRRLQARRRAVDDEWREVRRRGSITHVMQERMDSEAAAHVLERGGVRPAPRAGPRGHPGRAAADGGVMAPQPPRPRALARRRRQPP